MGLLDHPDSQVRDMARGRSAAWLAWNPRRLDGDALLDIWSDVVDRRGTPGTPDRIDVYVHFPYCQSSCRFCMYYHRVPKQTQAATGDFAEYLAATLARYRARNGRIRVLHAYCGGGTPSLLTDAQLDTALQAMARSFEVHGEWTLEMNPLSCTEAKLAAAAKHGVSRISMGVQAFEEATLKRIGRLNGPTTRTAGLVSAARDLGMEVNVDILLDVPGQTIDEMRGAVHQAMDLGSDMITVYRYQPTDRLPNEKAGEVRFGSTFERRLRFDAARRGYWASVPRDDQAFGASLIRASTAVRRLAHRARHAIEHRSSERLTLDDYVLYQGVGHHLMAFGTGAIGHAFGRLWYREVTVANTLNASAAPVYVGTALTVQDEATTAILAAAERGEALAATPDDLPPDLAEAIRPFARVAGGKTKFDGNQESLAAALMPPRPDDDGSLWSDPHLVEPKLTLPRRVDTTATPRSTAPTRSGRAHDWVLRMDSDLGAPYELDGPDRVLVQVEPEPAPALVIRAVSADGSPAYLEHDGIALKYVDRPKSPLTTAERRFLDAIASRVTDG